MADEIRVSCSLSASKGGASINTVGTSQGASFSFDMTGTDMGSGTQAIGFAADEQLVLPADVGTIKYLFLYNLDATNYVELSYATGGGFVSRVQIDAGCPVLLRPTSATIYLKANTAACNIFWAVVEV